MSKIFSILTFPLGLPIDEPWSFLIMITLSGVAYLIAWNYVGKMYMKRVISGGITGSVLHWIVRIASFFIIYGALYAVLSLVNFFAKYPSTLMIIPTVGASVFLCVETVRLMRAVKEWRSGKNA